MTYCGFDEYLRLFDEGLNKTPEFAGMFTNLVTQVVTGAEKEDTTFFVVMNNLMAHFDKSDYEGLGRDMQQFASRLVVCDASNLSLEVEPLP